MSRWDDKSGYGPTYNKGLEPLKSDSKIVTGYCADGSHEGMPKKTKAGQLKECLYAHHCSCDCHTQERTLRSLMKLPDPVFAVPGAPIPDLLGIVTDISGAILSGNTPEPVKPERSVRTGPDSALRQRLEWRIYQICLKYEIVDAHLTNIMTIQFFQTNLKDETSPGAIDAVLKRWAENGFATMGKHPNRFTGFTAMGSEMGLEGFLESRRKK